jgi:hypothetical protein
MEIKDRVRCKKKIYCIFSLLVYISFVVLLFIVDLSSWRHQIESKSEAAELHDGSSQEDEVESDVSPPSPVKFKNGVLTIGCIGEYNNLVY